MTDTIFAPATPAGRGGIAVLRISGPSTKAALRALTGRSTFKPRTATLVAISDPDDRETLDRGLALWFPAPASYTGDDVAELHLHGGRAVTVSVLGCLGRLPALRPAEPGEFTRRAFENGKLDLTQAEAIADLVDAETQAQRRQALRQMDGALGRLYDGWRERLVRALAHLEAWLDFPDEDIPPAVFDILSADLSVLRGEIGAHLDDGHRGERLRDGVFVAIVGAPNVGKSSLLNRLARRDVALVSEQAGTTRDVIETALDLGGVPVILADMAGLRDAENVVEQAGIARARQRADDADLRLVMFDGSDAPDFSGPALDYLGPGSLCVVNKSDLSNSVVDRVRDQPAIAISARTGQGIDRLLAALAESVGNFSTSAAPVLTRQRHRAALLDTVAALDATASASSQDLLAEDVRRAAQALGRITGRVGVEELLDRVFADFCIGK